MSDDIFYTNIKTKTLNVAWDWWEGEGGRHKNVLDFLVDMFPIPSVIRIIYM